MTVSPSQRPIDDHGPHLGDAVGDGEDERAVLAGLDGFARHDDGVGVGPDDQPHVAKRTGPKQLVRRSRKSP